MVTLRPFHKRDFKHYAGAGRKEDGYISFPMNTYARIRADELGQLQRMLGDEDFATLDTTRPYADDAGLRYRWAADISGHAAFAAIIMSSRC